METVCALDAAGKAVSKLLALVSNQTSRKFKLLKNIFTLG